MSCPKHAFVDREGEDGTYEAFPNYVCSDNPHVSPTVVSPRSTLCIPEEYRLCIGRFNGV
jgi:hypothetical protein